jgi:hypothetical protein
MKLTLKEEKGFGQALADGVLLDVTKIAESIDFHANVYVSHGYWSIPPISRTVEGLKAALGRLAVIFEHGIGTMGDSYDGDVVWTYPLKFAQGGELANYLHCWRTLPHNRLNLVVLAYGERLDFRIARSVHGSLYTQ